MIAPTLDLSDLDTDLRSRPQECEVRTPTCTGDVDTVHPLVDPAHGGSLTDARNLLLACRPCVDELDRLPDRALLTGRRCPAGDAVEGYGGLVPSPEWIAWRDQT